MDKLTLKHDLTIPAGTEFECIDGTTRLFHSGNYETIVADGDNRIIAVCLEKDSTYFKEK